MRLLGSTLSARRLAALALAITLLPGAAAPVAAGQLAVDLLPDLQMAPLFDVYLQTTKKGHLLLRFGTLVNNVGDGPLIVRANHRQGDQMTRIVQKVRLSDGTTRRILQPDAAMYYEPLGVHVHWHLRDFISMRLTPLTQTEPPLERHARKIGFCLIDTSRMPAEQRPPNSTLRTFYDCGTDRSKKVRMGISVGWGDTYLAYYRYQSIKITDLPSGTYRLCSIANPQAMWLEQSADNNIQWLDLDIDTSAKTVEVVDSGSTDCANV